MEAFYPRSLPEVLVSLLPEGPAIILLIAISYLVHAIADDIDHWLRRHWKWGHSRLRPALALVARVAVYMVAALYFAYYIHSAWGTHPGH